MSSDELADLLHRSRANNADLDITGMLLYRDGNFIQMLEGPEHAVDRLHERIAADPRHHQMMTLLRGPLEGRHFDGWSMGFRDTATLTEEERRGYSDFLNTPFRADEFGEDPHRALRLLLSFKRACR